MPLISSKWLSWVFSWQPIHFVCWACLSTDRQYSYGTNCAFLLADLFLYLYEEDFMQGLLKKLTRSFNFTFRYIDDALSLNNCTFGDIVDRNCWVCFIPWHTPQKWQWRFVKKETSWQTRWLQFPHLHVAAFQQNLHMDISLRWSDIPELVDPIMISVIEVYCEQGSY